MGSEVVFFYVSRVAVEALRVFCHPKRKKQLRAKGRGRRRKCDVRFT